MAWWSASTSRVGVVPRPERACRGRATWGDHLFETELDHRGEKREKPGLAVGDAGWLGPFGQHLGTHDVCERGEMSVRRPTSQPGEPLVGQDHPFQPLAGGRPVAALDSLGRLGEELGICLQGLDDFPVPARRSGCQAALTWRLIASTALSLSLSLSLEGCSPAQGQTTGDQGAVEEFKGSSCSWSAVSGPLGQPTAGAT